MNSKIKNVSYVRETISPAKPPPSQQSGLMRWIRDSFFASPADTIMTVIVIAVLLWSVPPLANWLFINASWTGTGREVCTTLSQGGIQADGWRGACWAFVDSKFDQFIFGRYPQSEQWRPIIVFILFFSLLVALLTPKIPFKKACAVSMFVLFPTLSFILLLGGIFGLSYIETSEWGGLLVTLVLSYVGISISLPLGILLALGRRSELPIIKTLSIAYIECLRGIPLLAVLFMASVLLPMFLPADMTVDKFLRAVIGVALFASAYMAEVIRGGLQAIPKGQSEGADSLGMTHVQKTLLIILPQALKLVIPGIVNTFIGLFKDTSLVTIIAMYDLLGIVRLNFSDPNWASPVTPLSGLIFAGFMFWIFCFAMSRYSIFVEKKLERGLK